MIGARAAVPLCAALFAAVVPAGAGARTLLVGPGRAYDRPSAAAAVARAGDTVLIAAGEYFDCARWRADGLTIAGEVSGTAGGQAGGDVTLTDLACDGKAAFVIEGNGVTIRHLGFARIRVPDDNGAGIRASGRDLTVEDSRFTNTQIGILAQSPAGGFLRVTGCRFRETGASLDASSDAGPDASLDPSPGGRVNSAIHADGFDLVRVEASDFGRARGGADMALRARRVELVDDRMEDAAAANPGQPMRGPLVMVEGGALLLQGNRIAIAAGASARPGAVLATGAASSITVRGNVMEEAGPLVPLLRNWTGQPATVEGNHVSAGGETVSDAGLDYHRLRATAAGLRDQVHAAWSAARHYAGIVWRAAD